MSTLELTSKQLDELNLELESTWKCVSLSAHTDTDADTDTRAHPSMFDTPMKNDQKWPQRDFDYNAVPKNNSVEKRGDGEDERKKNVWYSIDEKIAFSVLKKIGAIEQKQPRQK